MRRDPLLARLQVAEKEFLHFALVFSRFEYALKSSLVFARGNENSVEANWDMFAKVLDKYFNPKRHEVLRKSVEYLCAHPPMKQVLLNSELRFEPFRSRENEPTLVRICDAIRVVRNNLFHGGKFETGPVIEPARDRDLLAASCTILEECIELSGVVEDERLAGVHKVFVCGLD